MPTTTHLVHIMATHCTHVIIRRGVVTHVYFKKAKPFHPVTEPEVEASVLCAIMYREGANVTPVAHEDR